MPNYTPTINLKTVNMETDGDELFDFGYDLDNNWRKIDTAIKGILEQKNASGIPPSICTALRKTKANNKVYLKWKDPDDTVIDGQVLCSWAKTVIVGKAGSVPENESDGDIVIENKTRNAYNLTPLEITLPESEQEYYFKAFPISLNGVVCLDSQNTFGMRLYSFIINPTDSNPATRVVYQGECENYKPAKMNYATGEFDYGDWKKAFFMSLFRPCMLNPDGTVKHYLYENDYSFQADGITPSDIANTTQTANAMVEIGQIWIKEENLEGGAMKITIGNESFEGADCYTHQKKDGTYSDFVYRSIYDGCNISNKIRSLSGQAICKNVAGDTQIAYAKANGTGWNVDEYSLRRLINYLLILIGKSTDTQTTFGTGRYSGGSQNNNNQLNTGTLDKKGMFYGDNSNGAVKVFHIENWWGNIWKITNGCIQKNGKLLYKMCEGTSDGSTVQDYNSTGDGYIDSGVVANGTVTEQYIKKMTLVPGIGLVPNNDSGGSSSTYFCDGWWSNSTVVGFARFGCQPANGLLVGAFAFTVSAAVSHSLWYSGVSLSFKPSSGG